MSKLPLAITLGLALLLTQASLLRPPSALAFEEDAHYDLKFAMALRIGCLTWAEALEVATGDWGQDKNMETVAWLDSPNNAKWHAFGPDDDVDVNKQAGVLWNRVTAAGKETEKQRLKLGQYLHFVEDRFAHKGYPTNIGHGWDTLAGKDPDSMAKAPQKTRDMVKASLDALSKYCVDVLKKPADGVDDIIVKDDKFKALIEKLIADSKEDWKKGVGSLKKEDATKSFYTDAGLQVLKDNKATIDKYIRDNIDLVKKQAPQAIQDAAKAGGTIVPKYEDKPVKYDKDGEPVQLGGQKLTLAPVLPESLGSDLALTNFQVGQLLPVVSMSAAVVNVGHLATLPAPVFFYVANLDADSAVAVAEVDVPSLAPGESFDLLAVSDVIDLPSEFGLGAAVDLDDADASNNFAFLSTDLVGGVTELRVGASRGEADADAGGGNDNPSFAIAAGAVAAAVVALAVGGWYARRRWLGR
ncbi:MAG: hypothetical protein Q7T33_16045 [Dehalococcoidia bacterium]|nr:hypothetical protein [Dehalococcoidia bacterium]